MAKKHAVNWMGDSSGKKYLMKAFRRQNCVVCRCRDWPLFSTLFPRCFLSSDDFFSQNYLLQKILSGTLSKCQTVWIQIRTDVLSSLIRVQHICKRSPKVAATCSNMSKKNVNKRNNNTEVMVDVTTYMNAGLFTPARIQTCLRIIAIKQEHSLFANTNYENR